MSQGANVRFITALEDFKGALSCFSGEAQEGLRAAEQLIQQTEEWLEERENYWRHQAHRQEENVHRAEAALSRCENSGRYDDKGYYHEPDCSAYENSLRLAENRLEEAEDELRNVRRWMKVVSEAVSVYQGEAHRLGHILANDLSRADALLGRKIADLEKYVAIGGAGTGDQLSSSETGSSAGLTGETDRSSSLFGHPEVRKGFSQAYKDSNPGTPGSHEEGGWIVKDGSGRIAFKRWPPGERKSISFSTENGEINRKNTVGWFHTHPTDGGPPSRSDIENTKMVGMDHHVISRDGNIYLIDSKTGEVSIVGKISDLPNVNV